MSLKEEMAKHRKYEDLLKDQAPERTWAMDKPAYCYTEACPVHSLRKPILEAAQTPAEYQGREGRKDLPDLPEAMAGGMRPEEL